MKQKAAITFLEAVKREVGARRWKRLSPEQRKAIRDIDAIKRLSPEQRKAIRDIDAMKRLHSHTRGERAGLVR